MKKVKVLEITDVDFIGQESAQFSSIKECYEKEIFIPHFWDDNGGLPDGNAFYFALLKDLPGKAIVNSIKSGASIDEVYKTVYPYHEIATDVLQKEKWLGNQSAEIAFFKRKETALKYEKYLTIIRLFLNSGFNFNFIENEIVKFCKTIGKDLIDEPKNIINKKIKELKVVKFNLFQEKNKFIDNVDKINKIYKEDVK